MPDNDGSIGKILGSIVAIITIILFSIQINKETNFINSIKIFIVNSWVWFIRAKIPLSWIPIGLIVYFLGKFLLKGNELDEYVREHYHLFRILEKEIHRNIILYCIEPRTVEQIFKEISTNWRNIETITPFIRDLEERNGLIYIEEYNMWQSTKEALDIIAKYHIKSHEA